MKTKCGPLLAVLSLALAFVLAACGGDDADDIQPTPTEPAPSDAAMAEQTEPTAEPSPSPKIEPTPAPSPSPTATAEPTPAPSPDPSPTTAPTPGPATPILTDADLEAFLLAPDDAPEAWEVNLSYGNHTQNPPCDAGPPSNELVEAPFAQIDFERGSPDSMVGHVVIWMEHEEDAVDAMNWYRQAFECETFEDQSGMGWQSLILEFTDLGNESFARELTSEDEDTLIILQYAFVRQGQFMTFLAQSETDAADADLLESLLRIAVERLPE